MAVIYHYHNISSYLNIWWGFISNINLDSLSHCLIKFSGVIKNNSLRPILTPRIKVLAIREDRKILIEKIIVTNEKIIMPSSTIEFNDFSRINSK